MVTLPLAGLAHESEPCFPGDSIHPRLPHDTPHPPSAHLQPRIHPCPIRREAPTRGPLAQGLDLVASSDSNGDDVLGGQRRAEPIGREAGPGVDYRPCPARCCFCRSSSHSGITKSSVTLPSGSWISSSVSIRGIWTSRFLIRAVSVLGEIFLRLGSASGPFRVARTWAMATDSGGSAGARFVVGYRVAWRLVGFPDHDNLSEGPIPSHAQPSPTRLASGTYRASCR
jgi:hypothetical protein